MSDPKNRGRNSERKGPISQRHLVTLMKPVIDAAMSKSSSLTRDQARQTVRRLMAETNWNTPFVKHLLGTKRCRYLSKLGYIIEPQYLAASEEDKARLIAYMEGRRG
jgi:hypothetical protein